MPHSPRQRDLKGRASAHKLIAFFSSLAVLKAGTFQRSVQMSNQFSLNGNGNGNGNDGHRSFPAASALVIRALDEKAVTLKLKRSLTSPCGFSI